MKNVSKIKLYLLPILACAVLAFAVFGIFGINNAQPTQASAEGETVTTVTVHYYNSLGWENVKIHYWGGTSSTNWPGVAMNYNSEKGYYSYEIPSDTTGIIFNNGNGVQTGDLAFVSSSPYYYGTYNSNIKEQQFNMKIANTWYIIGKIQGVENWIDSTYICDADSVNTNVAEWYNVTLYAGDAIKAVHGNDIPSLDQSKGRQFGADNSYSSCDYDGGNLKVTYTGVYNIYLYNLNGTYYISIAPSVIQATYYKASKNTKDGDPTKRYLLLVTAFDLNECGDATQIGYDVKIGAETTAYYGTTYYSKVNGSEPSTIYNDGFSEFKLIVIEIEIPVAETTITIQAKVKGSSGDLSTGVETTGTIPAMS